MVSKEIDYLIFVTAVPTVCFLIVVYFQIRKQGFKADIRELALQLIPNLLASLLAFIIVYVVIQRVLGQNVFDNIGTGASTDVQTLSAMSNDDLRSEVAK